MLKIVNEPIQLVTKRGREIRNKRRFNANENATVSAKEQNLERKAQNYRIRVDTRNIKRIKNMLTGDQ